MELSDIKDVELTEDDVALKIARTLTDCNREDFSLLNPFEKRLAREVARNISRPNVTAITDLEDRIRRIVSEESMMRSHIEGAFIFSKIRRFNEIFPEKDIDKLEELLHKLGVPEEKIPSIIETVETDDGRDLTFVTHETLNGDSLLYVDKDGLIVYLKAGRGIDLMRRELETNLMRQEVSVLRARTPLLKQLFVNGNYGVLLSYGASQNQKLVSVDDRIEYLALKKEIITELASKSGLSFDSIFADPISSLAFDAALDHVYMKDFLKEEIFQKPILGPDGKEIERIAPKEKLENWLIGTQGKVARKLRPAIRIYGRILNENECFDSVPTVIADYDFTPENIFFRNDLINVNGDGLYLPGNPESQLGACMVDESRKLAFYYENYRNLLEIYREQNEGIEAVHYNDKDLADKILKAAFLKSTRLAFFHAAKGHEKKSLNYAHVAKRLSQQLH